MSKRRDGIATRLITRMMFFDMTMRGILEEYPYMPLDYLLTLIEPLAREMRAQWRTR